MLDSSFKNYKKIEDEIPEETRITRSIKSNKEIVLKIKVSLKGKKSFISTKALWIVEQMLFLLTENGQEIRTSP